jgi:hypothetical protein
VVSNIASFIDRKTLTLKLWFSAEDIGAYDRVEIWKSETSAAGPYDEVTGTAWAPAELTTETGAKVLFGTELILKAGEVILHVPFDAAGPLDPSVVATVVSSYGCGLIRATGDDDLHLLTISTSDVGYKSRIEVLGGDAAAILGFPTYAPDSVANGRDARPRLSSPREAVLFEDVWSTPESHYRTRLRRLDGAVSEYSNPLSGNPTLAVSPIHLVRAWVRIVDVMGRPVGNRTVLISTTDTVHNSMIQGLLIDQSDISAKTDASGYASFLLIRGTKVSVAIAGTALVRDITPPEDPSIDAFNLFDPHYGIDDAFAVQVPNVTEAERMPCP